MHYTSMGVSAGLKVVAGILLGQVMTFAIRAFRYPPSVHRWLFDPSFYYICPSMGYGWERGVSFMVHSDPVSSDRVNIDSGFILVV